ncbi:integrase arm-type DNA-binding domain-containing protein [uncultured Cardiobacterium sp.]|uniref:tyrosine-type recombinase/integrase n=1 Tax=uncultured Cardiobacterium sp. TaxID=417619 RepID=UPI0026067746|nr:integrase arm-type DNA-binding domain-containing protein [uncultured Cardiobacterium sp.]
MKRLCWRYRYRFDGQDCILSPGVYPKVRLRQARQLHRDAQSLLAQGSDPHRRKQQRKQAEKQQDSFGKVAREWYAHQRPAWKNEKHARQVIHTLERYVFPHIGGKAVSGIPPPAIVGILNRLADRPETRTRVKQRISAVFAFAIQTGRRPLNPALSAPKTVRSAQNRIRHQPSLPVAEIPAFFRDLERYPNRKTALALRLLILTLTRSGEVRLGQWAELRGDQWHIPAERMKMGLPMWCRCRIGHWRRWTNCAR